MSMASSSGCSHPPTSFGTSTPEKLSKLTTLPSPERVGSRQWASTGLPEESVLTSVVGLVTLRETGGRLAFAAPPLMRSGPVDEADLERTCRVLAIDRSEVVGAQWADNGPGWLAVMLASADAVLALEPDFGAGDGYDIGVVGPYPVGVVGPTKIGAVAMTGSDPAIEVRAFFRAGGAAAEDPVTGSLNAALAQWLLADGTLTAPYVASQGTALGRAGRVHVDQADGEIWVGGDAVTCVDGTIDA